jgi:hypothetical protein
VREVPTPKRLPFVQDDDGRHAARFIPSGDVGDCVARSIATASGRNYTEVWEALALGMARQRRSKRTHPAYYGMRSASYGIHVNRKWFKYYMHELGFEWVQAMRIGQKRRVRLQPNDLPMGRLVVSVSRHYTAVIDGVIHDTYPPGQQVVFGYWRFTGTVQEKPIVATPEVLKRVVPPQPRWVSWVLWASFFVSLAAVIALRAAGH